MSPAVLYRIASVLLLLFALGHTIGFRRVDPRWGIDAMIAGVKSTRFDVQGNGRTWWDFYVGFGLFVTLLLLFAGAVAWQLAGLPPEALRGLPLLSWGLAGAFAGVTYLSWRYFFRAPVVFSLVIALLLIAAAWSSGQA